MFVDHHKPKEVYRHTCAMKGTNVNPHSWHWSFVLNTGGALNNERGAILNGLWYWLATTLKRAHTVSQFILNFMLGPWSQDSQQQHSTLNFFYCYYCSSFSLDISKRKNKHGRQCIWPILCRDCVFSLSVYFCFFHLSAKLYIGVFFHQHESPFAKS